jgi:hypothetical protein
MFSVLPPCIKLCTSKVLNAKRKHEISKRVMRVKSYRPEDQASMAAAVTVGLAGVSRRTTGSGSSWARYFKIRALRVKRWRVKTK